MHQILLLRNEHIFPEEDNCNCVVNCLDPVVPIEPTEFRWERPCRFGTLHAQILIAPSYLSTAVQEAATVQ